MTPTRTGHDAMSGRNTRARRNSAARKNTAVRQASARASAAGRTTGRTARSSRSMRSQIANKPARVKKNKLGRIDISFFFLVVTLVTIGLIMVFSASYATSLNAKFFRYR